MPKDTREVYRGIAVTSEEGKYSVVTDVDELAAIHTQEELDAFVEQGVIGGEWKSVRAEKSAPTGAFPEDYPGFDVLGQVEGMTPEKIASMSDAEVLEISGIGPATLKAIRSYGK